MIHLRIDNRLIHGQVTTTWTKATKADLIIVASDQIANDQMQVMLLKMSAGATDCLVLSISDAAEHINNNKNINILVVCKTTSDALSLTLSGVISDQVNIGNSPKVQEQACRKYSRSVYLTQEGIADCHSIKKYIDAAVTVQMMPDDSIVTINDEDTVQ